MKKIPFQMLTLLVLFVSLLASCTAEEKVKDDGVLLTPENTDEHGLLIGTDTRRIVIICDDSGILLLNDEPLDERENRENLYDKNGEKSGVVYKLGSTGRKQYVLRNADSEHRVIVAGQVRIEYIEMNGVDDYYKMVVEYDTGEKTAVFFISNYETMEVVCVPKGETLETADPEDIIAPTHVYSQEELDELNTDE